VGFLALSPAFAGAGEDSFRGELWRRGTQRQEALFKLEARREPGQWVDHYRDARGADAVIERVQFQDGKPRRYEFDDRQQGGLGSVDVEEGRLRLRWQQDGKVQEKLEKAPAELIFGPLYPELLKRRWEDLAAGRKVTGTVPVLSRDRLMTATLAFQRRPAKDRGDGTLCVEMKPANWFVALFFPPIDLHLDPATRRLRQVEGMSLLKEKVKGEWKMTEVELQYDYTGPK